jgi:hypothetical protein
MMDLVARPVTTVMEMEDAVEFHSLVPTTEILASFLIAQNPMVFANITSVIIWEVLAIVILVLAYRVALAIIKVIVAEE